MEKNENDGAYGVNLQRDSIIQTSKFPQIPNPNFQSKLTTKELITFKKI